jgi:hypothetical protein
LGPHAGSTQPLLRPGGKLVDPLQTSHSCVNSCAGNDVWGY